MLFTTIVVTFWNVPSCQHPHLHAGFAFCLRQPAEGKLSLANYVRLPTVGVPPTSGTPPYHYSMPFNRRNAPWPERDCTRVAKSTPTTASTTTTTPTPRTSPIRGSW